MKRTLLFLLAGLLFASCSAFKTIVELERKLQPVDMESPFYIYYDKWNDLPDDAEYLGDFRVSVKPQYYFTIPQLMYQVEEKAKEAGGNLVMIDIPEDDEVKYSKYITGKIYRMEELESTNYTREGIISKWEKDGMDGIEGIFEEEISYIDNEYKGQTANYAVVKQDDGNFVMVYLDGFEGLKETYVLVSMGRYWNEGDIQAYIKPTDKKSLFSARVYTGNKYMLENCMLRVDNTSLRIARPKGTDYYRKIYPEEAPYEYFEGSLTGYALAPDKIVTCYHGLKDKELKVYVKGINGDFDTKHLAEVDKVDKALDIAVIKLKDNNAGAEFTPFPVSTKDIGIAEEVFVLGYPISDVMGEEIKLTNGIINSTSGHGGNMNYFQFSAPVQPGNSGSPTFDKNGNLIGMVTSGISKADNVGYSLKMQKIKDFFFTNGYEYIESELNSFEGLSLAEKVKKLKESIYIIEIINTEPPENEEEDDPRKARRAGR